MTGRRALALPATLLLGWLLLSIPDGLTGFDLLAGVFAGAVGLLAGAAWPGARDRAARALAATEDLLGEGEGEGGSGSASRAGAGVASGDGDDGALVDAPLVEPAVDPLTTLLDRIAATLGASRVVVWRAREEEDRVVPLHGTAALPEAVAAAGSPFLWALREATALRLDPVPRWARGATVVAPIDDDRLLSVETPVETPARPADVAEAGAILALFLGLHDGQAGAVAATRRLERVIAFLRSLSGAGPSGAGADGAAGGPSVAPGPSAAAGDPDALLDTALEVTGATGGLVASWSAGGSSPEEGVGGDVLVRVGAGGGPGPGMVFGPGDGDLAHAARTGSTIRRRAGDGRWPPLAGEERWERPPPTYRTAIPLIEPGGDTTGVLAVWGRSPLAEQGEALLEAVGPLLALQVRQAGELERFRERATADALTGLPNRGALEERMEQEVARFHRYRRPTAVLVVDLDHFKRINDTWGHDAGDAVLRRVADVLRGAVREVDFPARFGGEELVVVLPETMLRAALDVAERVRSSIEAAVIEHEGQRIPVTASIGVSACPECVEDPGELFGSADRALYVSKEGGRNRVTGATQPDLVP